MDSLAKRDKTKNILVINQNWFVKELKDFGHKIITIGLETEGDFDIGVKKKELLSISDVFKLLPSNFSPDCLIYYDNSRNPTLNGFEYVEIPSIFFSVDSHHHYDWHSVFSSMFDLALVAHKDYVSNFKDKVKEVKWFPLWSPIDIEPEEKKTIQVSFRGNLDKKLHPGRVSFLEDISKEVNLDAKSGRYEDVYRRSKIVINEAVNKDLNFRVFEAMISGALLITPKIENGLLDLFKDGTHLVTYKDKNSKDAIRLIKYYLENDELREKIAKKGRDFVLKNHSRKKRALELNSYILNLKKSKRKYRYISSSCLYLKFSRTCKNSRFNLSKKYAIYSANSIIESVKKKEPKGDNFLCLATSLIFRLYELSLEKEGDELLFFFIENYKEESLYRAILANKYLEKKERAKAIECVKGFREETEKYLEELPKIISNIKKGVKNLPVILY